MYIPSHIVFRWRSTNSEQTVCLVELPNKMPKCRAIPNTPPFRIPLHSEYPSIPNTFLLILFLGGGAQTLNKRRVWLNCPIKCPNAERMGAKYDADKRRYYVPDGVDPEPLLMKFGPTMIGSLKTINEPGNWPSRAWKPPNRQASGPTTSGPPSIAPSIAHSIASSIAK